MGLLTGIEKLIDSYFAVIPRIKPKQEHVNNALLIAHRGAHNNAQGILENTHAAFKLAREAGCWGLEFDIHATADEVLVVNHDPDLNRLWGYNVRIADLTFTQLRELEPGVPSLAEVISDYGRDMHLFIELKAPFRAEQALADTLKHLTPGKDYHLLALDKPTFAHFSQFPKQSLLLVAMHNNVREFCALSLKEQYGGVMGSYLLLTNKRINALQAAQQKSGVGFVDSKNSLYRELSRGISWIFTNQAVAVSKWLGDLKSE